MAVVINLIQGLFTAYWYILLATAIISWIPDLQNTKIGQLLARLTEPYLGIFRRYIKPLAIGPVQLDLSWLVGVIVFFVIEHLVLSLLVHLAVQMQ